MLHMHLFMDIPYEFAQFRKYCYQNKLHDCIPKLLQTDGRLQVTLKESRDATVNVIQN